MRLFCIVPHCRRTRPDRFGAARESRGVEWICQEHWACVPPDVKRVKRWAEHRARKTGTAKAQARAVKWWIGGQTVWEPAAGNHLMADVLREGGAAVITSDIATYDRRHDATVDFLAERFTYKNPKHDAIVTNPPYGKGNREAVLFAELALCRCSGIVALLLTAKFDFGKTRRHLFADNPRFLAKINLVDRIQWFPGETTGTEDHAWYVWGSKREAVAPFIFYEGRTRYEK